MLYRRLADDVEEIFVLLHTKIIAFFGVQRSYLNVCQFAGVYMVTLIT